MSRQVVRLLVTSTISCLQSSPTLFLLSIRPLSALLYLWSHLSISCVVILSLVVSLVSSIHLVRGHPLSCCIFGLIYPSRAWSSSLLLYLWSHPSVSCVVILSLVVSLASSIRLVRGHHLSCCIFGLSIRLLRGHTLSCCIFGLTHPSRAWSSSLLLYLWSHPSVSCVVILSLVVSLVSSIRLVRGHPLSCCIFGLIHPSRAWSSSLLLYLWSHPSVSCVVILSLVISLASSIRLLRGHNLSCCIFGLIYPSLAWSYSLLLYLWSHPPVSCVVILSLVISLVSSIRLLRGHPLSCYIFGLIHPSLAWSSSLSSLCVSLVSSTRLLRGHPLSCYIFGLIHPSLAWSSSLLLYLWSHPSVSCVVILSLVVSLVSSIRLVRGHPLSCCIFGLIHPSLAWSSSLLLYLWSHLSVSCVVIISLVVSLVSSIRLLRGHTLSCCIFGLIHPSLAWSSSLLLYLLSHLSVRGHHLSCYIFCLIHPSRAWSSSLLLYLWSHPSVSCVVILSLVVSFHRLVRGHPLSCCIFGLIYPSRAWSSSLLLYLWSHPSVSCVVILSLVVSLVSSIRLLRGHHLSCYIFGLIHPSLAWSYSLLLYLWSHPSVSCVVILSLVVSLASSSVSCVVIISLVVSLVSSIRLLRGHTLSCCIFGLTHPSRAWSSSLLLYLWSHPSVSCVVILSLVVSLVSSIHLVRGHPLSCCIFGLIYPSLAWSSSLLLYLWSHPSVSCVVILSLVISLVSSIRLLRGHPLSCYIFGLIHPSLAWSSSLLLYLWSHPSVSCVVILSLVVSLVSPIRLVRGHPLSCCIFGLIHPSRAWSSSLLLYLWSHPSVSCVVILSLVVSLVSSIRLLRGHPLSCYIFGLIHPSLAWSSSLLLYLWSHLSVSCVVILSLVVSLVSSTRLLRGHPLSCYIFGLIHPSLAWSSSLLLYLWSHPSVSCVVILSLVVSLVSSIRLLRGHPLSCYIFGLIHPSLAWSSSLLLYLLSHLSVSCVVISLLLYLWSHPSVSCVVILSLVVSLVSPIISCVVIISLVVSLVSSSVSCVVILSLVVSLVSSTRLLRGHPLSCCIFGLIHPSRAWSSSLLLYLWSHPSVSCVVILSLVVSLVSSIRLLRGHPLSCYIFGLTHPSRAWSYSLLLYLWSHIRLVRGHPLSCCIFGLIYPSLAWSSSLLLYLWSHPSVSCVVILSLVISLASSIRLMRGHHLSCCIFGLIYPSLAWSSSLLLYLWPHLSVSCVVIISLVVSLVSSIRLLRGHPLSCCIFGLIHPSLAWSSSLLLYLWSHPSVSCVVILSLVISLVSSIRLVRGHPLSCYIFGLIHPSLAWSSSLLLYLWSHPSVSCVVIFSLVVSLVSPIRPLSCVVILSRCCIFGLIHPSLAWSYSLLLYILVSSIRLLRGHPLSCYIFGLIHPSRAWSYSLLLYLWSHPSVSCVVILLYLTTGVSSTFRLLLYLWSGLIHPSLAWSSSLLLYLWSHPSVSCMVILSLVVSLVAPYSHDARGNTASVSRLLPVVEGSD